MVAVPDHPPQREVDRAVIDYGDTHRLTVTGRAGAAVQLFGDSRQIRAATIPGQRPVQLGAPARRPDAGGRSWVAFRVFEVLAALDLDCSTRTRPSSPWPAGVGAAPERADGGGSPAAARCRLAAGGGQSVGRPDLRLQRSGEPAPFGRLRPSPLERFDAQGSARDDNLSHSCRVGKTRRSSGGSRRGPAHRTAPAASARQGLLG